MRVAEAGRSATRKARESLPVDRLGGSTKKLLKAMTVRTVQVVGTQAGHLADRMTEALGEEVQPAAGKATDTGGKAPAGGMSPLEAGLKAGMSAGVTVMKEKAKDAFGATAGRVVGAVGGGGDGGDGEGADRGGPDVVNIVEEFDVALPLRVAYDQWTRFEDFPAFTKKVESVEQESDEKLNWRAQIFFSHRTWESTIVEQVPDERIVWRSKGPKGFADGVVTFHELTPNLTKVMLVVEYHPDGFFEKTANLWRAQGRRLRLEFKNIKRHMMTRTLLEQPEVEGWRGEIRDGEVVRTHQEAIEEERRSAGRSGDAAESPAEEAEAGRRVADAS